MVKAPTGGFGEIVSGIAGAAQADLKHLVGRNQPFFIGTPKHRAMGFALAKHLVVHIRVGVDMHQGQGPMPGRHRAQDRQRQRMIAAEGHGDEIMPQV